MPDEPTKTGSWWTTLPGILTAAAGVITALTGLLVVLSQNGVFGAKNKGPTPTVTSTVDAKPNAGQTIAASALSPSERPASPPPASSSAPALQSIPYKSVRVTLRDGSIVQVRDDFKVGPAPKIDLKTGQSIDFSRIARIDVVEITDVYTSGTARIQLNNGVALDAKFDPYYDLKGHNDLGEFSSRWPEVKTVEFIR